MVKVSIIMPAYNEEKRIGRTLEAYSKYFELLRKEEKLEYEILVVINNTIDRTEQIVQTHLKNNRRISYLNLKPGGKGFAIIEGFREALKRDNDFIGFVDADMATSPQEYFKLIDNVGSSPGIIASRYIKGAVIRPKPTVQRLMAKRLFNIWIRT